MPLARRRGATVLQSSNSSHSQMAAPSVPVLITPSNDLNTPTLSENHAFRDRLEGLPAGYPTLAAKMEILPEVAMFRQFGALNARNLLYLQCELSTLEKRLKELELRDSALDEGMKKQYVKDAWRLTKSTKERDGDTEQRSLVNLIRLTLKEYNNALIQQEAILKMKQPDKYDLKYLQNFFQTPTMGPLALIGDDAMVWGTMLQRNDYADDLVALKPQQEGDFISRWVAEHAITFLHKSGLARFKRPDRVSGVVGYNDASIFRFMFWLKCLVVLSALVGLSLEWMKLAPRVSCAMV